jgi:subtilisin family serine protease
LFQSFATVPDTPANPNDEIRAQILRYFYDRNAGATSRQGKKGSAVKISGVKKELKSLHGLTQQQVMSNLTYLIDRSWVKVVDQEKTINTARGTTIPSVVTFYQITAQGIEKIEGPSQFQPPDRYPGINIQATGANVITLGDGNYVNVKHQGMFTKLSELKEALTASPALSDTEKLEVAVDIETLKDQLVKPVPDREVVGRLWPRIEKAAAVAGLGSFVLELGQLAQKLLQ